MSATVTGLVVRAGERAILDKIDMRVRPGSLTALIGPNGSGKSTLLNALAGVGPSHEGAIRVADLDPQIARRQDLAQVLAYVEQESATDANLTVEDVVGLGRTPWHGTATASQQRPVAAQFAANSGRRRPGGRGPRQKLRFERAGNDPLIDRALRLAGIEHLRGRRWATLSGGERQRTHLARAIAQQPTVLLLDEPTNHLDVRHQLDFFANVRSLGLTTLAAMHDLSLTAMFFDDLVALRGGKVVAAGPVEQVLTSQLIADVFDVAADVRHDHRGVIRIDLMTPIGANT